MSFPVIFIWAGLPHFKYYPFPCDTVFNFPIESHRFFYPAALVGLFSELQYKVYSNLENGIFRIASGWLVGTDILLA